MTDGAPPRVFISYSHDSPDHQARVLELADRLRSDGIDAIIDQYIPFPPEGWPDWCEAQIRTADFVLMVCTETYFRRVNGEEERGKGHGVRWEGRLSNQHLYDAGSASRKFVPLLFFDGSPAHIPAPVKGGTIYRVETTEGYENLLRLLTDQPLTPMPPLGQRKSLPPKERRSAGSTLAEPAKPAASLPHPRVEDEPQLRRALEIREKNLGPEHPATAAALQELGWFLGEGAGRAEAERLFRRALTIREQTSGRDHPDTASALQGLGWALRLQGKYQEAEPLLRRALEIRAPQLGDDRGERRDHH